MKRIFKIFLVFICIATFTSCKVEDAPSHSYNGEQPGGQPSYPSTGEWPFYPSTEEQPSHSYNQASSIDLTGGYEIGTSKATQTAKYLGVVKRNVPTEAKDAREEYGVREYPAYGKNLRGYTPEEMKGLIQESRSLTPYPTWKSLNIYDALDSEGYLLRNGEKVKDENGEFRKIYKHTASIGMYGGDVAPEEPAISKRLTYLSRTGLATTQITGVYAPAGEVVKIEISQEDLEKTGGLRVYIGQNYNIDQHVSMEWTETSIKGSGFSRMSDILNIFAINSTEAYVGSFLGGPIYVRPVKNSVSHNFSVTITGGVRYQHFILGATTKEEYEFNKASSAPYFDLEIYDNAIRFTTSKHVGSGGKYLRDYTYEDCTKGAILWDKITQVSTRVQANGLSSSKAPVVCIGDCYIAAGAAFANPGRNGIVVPPGWIAQGLDYDNFVKSGSWGIMHEYNHCWQGYGVGAGGEVTNNATTLVAYSLYTKISAARSLSGGVSGWNRFTDPGKALKELLTPLPENTPFHADLSVYATLLHNIGQDQYIQAANGGREAGSTIYYNKLVEATHMDMTYYFTDILNFNISDVLGGEGNPSNIGNLLKSEVDAVKAKNYPVFVPVSSTYQVGRSILYDGKKSYITTAQPFQYGTGEYILNFNNQNNFKNGNIVSTELVIPDGFTVKVKNVTQPKNGAVTLLENNQVKYSPNQEMVSGEFIVTLGITKDDGAFEVDDVDLVINLQQKNIMKRTTYTYDEEKMITDPSSVYKVSSNTFDFGTYNWTETIANVCPQESNTQIWAAGINYYDEVYNQNSTNKKELPVGQTIQTMDGLLTFSKANTYRIALKGRGKAALFLSLDEGKTWELAINIDRKSNGGTAYVEGNWKDIELKNDNATIYYKVVLIVSNNISDFFGIGVASKNADDTFTAIANASAYCNKAMYELETKPFVTDYFFTRCYSYDYINSSKASDHSVVSVNRTSWDGDKTSSFVIGNLFDGNANTNFLSNASKGEYVSAEKPFELVVDMKKEITANTVTFYGFNAKNNTIGNLGMPHSFKFYGSVDGSDYFLLVERENAVNTTKNVTFDFETKNLRYYKLIVTKTDNEKYFGMNKIEFAVSYPNGIVEAPNSKAVTFTGESWRTTNELCSFGRLFVGGETDYVEFQFIGTRFAYFANQNSKYGTVDIYVDGKCVAENINLNSKDEACSITYLSDIFILGNHKVKIVGKTGTFNVDSFAYWK